MLETPGAQDTLSDGGPDTLIAKGNGVWENFALCNVSDFN